MVTFGVFRFDPERLKLYNGTLPVRLAPQPAQVLRLLVESPGQTVTRDQIREALWPAGTYVEFELGLNTAVNRLRRALNDSAENPRYIETIPKTGYRFLAPVDRPAAQASEPVPEPRRQWRPWALALGLLLVVALGGRWWWQPAPAKPPQVITVALPVGAKILDLAVAPAGDQFAYIVGGGTPRVYRRYLRENFSRRVEGADGATAVCFSPDGERLSIVTENGIKLITADGQAQVILPLKGQGSEVAPILWTPENRIVYSVGLGEQAGIWSIPATGGAPQRVLSNQVKPEGVGFALVQQSLGGRLLFHQRLGPRHNSLWVLEAGKPRLVREGAMGGSVGGGQLVYSQDEALYAAPFDERALRVTGNAVELASGAGTKGWLGAIAGLTSAGRLVYLEPAALEARRLAWISDGADPAWLPLPPGEYEQVRISPVDPRVIALVKREARSRWSASTFHLDTHVQKTLLTTPVTRPRLLWAPDGQSLVISSELENGDFVNLYRFPANGKQPPVRLTEQPNFGQFPLSWRSMPGPLLFAEGTHPDTKADLKAYSWRDGTVQTVVATPQWDLDGEISPDGKWLAYASGPAVEPRIYVVPFPNLSPVEPRFIAPGRAPTWQAGGRGLLFSRDQQIWQVSLPGGTPRQWAAVGGNSFDYWSRPFDLAPGGRVLTMLRPTPVASQARFIVIDNVADAYRRAGQ
ncbi:MAG: winged helix-turn-helix domain-containing protein [Bryobacteraceae bacterium]|nr:winged helix-turn-helix domain-containing protein [Bryobacteraceae bacterium]